MRRLCAQPWATVTIAAVVLVAVLGGAALALSGLDDDQLPPEVAIAGVPVGGLAIDEARSRLERIAAARIRQRVVLRYPGGEVATTGSALGATAALDRALEQARRSRGRLERLAARLGLAAMVEIPLEFETDAKKLQAVLEGIERQVLKKPSPARVVTVGGEFIVLPAMPGIRLDVDAARRLLERLPASAQLPPMRIEPRISDADADAAKSVADALVAHPPAIVHESERLVLGPELLRRALRFEQRRRAGTIAVVLDPLPLTKPLRRTFARFEREARDASFAVDGKRVRLVPARRGVVVSVERTAASVVASPETREVPVLFDVVVPDITTAEAKRLRITELVSEFTTEYPCCAPRVTNIQLAAKILDGTIVRPGGRFSLNDALGRRTSERGFVPAPTIYDGRLLDDVGGGISQIATTLYNAAFFAGLELIAHTPHQFSISRYPMGREATVSWGGPELIFRNDWKAGILMKVTAAETSITVRFYSSTLGRRVETATSEPYDFRDATVIREPNPSLPPGSEVVVQDGGVRGFSVDYTRKVYRGKRLIRDEAFHVTYDPEDTVVEYGPPVAAEEPAEPATAAPAGQVSE